MDHRGGPGWITEGVLGGSHRGSSVDHIGGPRWIT